MNSITFGELLKQRRRELKKPLREVAGGIGFDQSLLSKVERNQLLAPARLIPLLAEALAFDYRILQEKYWSERIYQELKQVDFGKESLEIALRRLEQEQSGTITNLRKEKLIQKIQTYVDGQPIDKVWLFGSFARNEASRDSDIDLLVKFKPEEEIDLFDYIGMKQDLEDLTGRQVDLVEEGQELPKIRPIIQNEKQLIYERKAV